MDGVQMQGAALKLDTAAAPANVSAPKSGAEDVMISKDRWQYMHRLHADGHTVSQIARLTDADRKTVRACLDRSEWQPYRRQASAPTLLEPHMAWLTQRACQVHFSARILFQELCRDRGFTGSYDTVRNAVRPLRAQASAAALTQRRFETEPGEQAQVDWGQVRVLFGEAPSVVHIFVMTLGYSRRNWVEGFADEKLESLMSAHERAFDHFGGVCAELLYDRMRTVIVGTTANGQPHWNTRFEAFSKHWGFQLRVCRPYRAQTKGKVESGVKYVKRNFLPGRSFRDLADFNAQLLAWNLEIADVRVHGTTHQRPIDRFAAEAGALTASRDHPSFLQATVRERMVAEDWLITIDTNRYSVPWTLIGKKVRVVRVGELWQISFQDALVAQHAVLSGRHQLSVLPEHGPGATARNQRRRFAPATASAATPGDSPHSPEVEVRDPVVYEQIAEAA